MRTAFSTLALALALAAPSGAAEPAPAFALEGTGDSSLELEDAASATLVLVFYGNDQDWSAHSVLDLCRERAGSFRDVGARLCPIGIDEVESHEALLTRKPMPLPLYSDPRGELQRALGQEPGEIGWTLIDRRGALRGGAGLGSPDIDELLEAFAAALELAQESAGDASPAFVAVMGEPLAAVRDLETLPDGRVAALEDELVVLMLGSDNTDLDPPGERPVSLAVSAEGSLLVTDGSRVLRLVDADQWEAVYVSPEGLGEPITCLAAQDSAALYTLRGTFLGMVLPATLRTVAIEGASTGAVRDLRPDPGGGVLVLSGQTPWLQRIERDRSILVLDPDDELEQAPVAVAVDAAGRIFTVLPEDSRIHVLDHTGKIVSRFEARGGEVEGVPRRISIGAGYLDVALRLAGSRKHRILRFAP
jgi:peroxiredoxin